MIGYLLASALGISLGLNIVLWKTVRQLGRLIVRQDRVLTENNARWAKFASDMNASWEKLFEVQRDRHERWKRFYTAGKGAWWS